MGEKRKFKNSQTETDKVKSKEGRIDNLIKYRLDEDRFGFRKSRGTGEAILALRLM